MITRQEAADMSIIAFHGPGIYRDGTCHTWRRNGNTQLWKSDKRKDQFRVPVKYGMWQFGNITPVNAIHFHTAENCLTLKEMAARNESS